MGCTFETPGIKHGLSKGTCSLLAQALCHLLINMPYRGELLSPCVAHSCPRHKHTCLGNTPAPHPGLAQILAIRKQQQNWLW